MSVVLHIKKNVKKLLRNFEYSKTPKAKKLSELRIASEAQQKFLIQKVYSQYLQYTIIFTVQNKNQIIFH